MAFIPYCVLRWRRVIGKQFHYSFLADRTGELLLFIYFLSISIILFVDLYYNRHLTPESIYAVFSGFILIAVAFGFVLMFINNIHPNSLNGIGSQARLSAYIYFSLITLMTIGYGDIAPATEVSRSVVVFVSLIGHFYTVFITALIIGRLITNQTDNSSVKS